MKRVFILTVFLCLFPLFSSSALAAPYFYIFDPDDTDTAIVGTTKTLYLYLSTDTTLTVAQTVFTYDTSLLTGTTATLSAPSNAGQGVARDGCSYPAPMDPALGYSQFPPIFTSNKFLFACGFFNPGSVINTAPGIKVAELRFDAIDTGSAVFTFNAAQTKYCYFDSCSLTVGTSQNYTLTVNTTGGGTPTPTPTPSGSGTPPPTPTATPTASASATPTPITLTASDLTFVEIGAATSLGTDEGITLTAVEEDNTIPGSGFLEPRPPATPFIISLLQNALGGGDTGQGGEVLAVQSLRELLIPGKSKADKTVVLVNLISFLTFIILLAIIIWRLIVITRMNKLKNRHMSDLLSSELSVLESKINLLGNKDNKDQLKQDLEETRAKITKSA